MILTSIIAWVPVRSAWAHHSYAMFDAQRKLSVDATVKEFQWTNPHSWLEVMVPDAKGGAEEWSLELGPLVALHRAGWKPHTLQAGDKVTASFNPLRDGSHGGRLIKVVLPNGDTLYGQGGAATGQEEGAVTAPVPAGDGASVLH